MGYNLYCEIWKSQKKYKNKNILIAGCGAGSTLFDLYFYNANITAIDQSENAIEFIRSQFEEMEYETPELIANDLHDVELPANKFDYIICKGVLHHLENPTEVLKKFHKWLKSSGELTVHLYHKNSFVRIERNFIECINHILNIGRYLPEDFKSHYEWWDKYENPLWETYTKNEARQMMNEAGFNIDKLWTSDRTFGLFTIAILPPIMRKGLETLFNEYGWHIRMVGTIE